MANMLLKNPDRCLIWRIQLALFVSYISITLQDPDHCLIWRILILKITTTATASNDMVIEWPVNDKTDNLASTISSKRRRKS